MASLKEVKGRINSINGTLKITSAMKNGGLFQAPQGAGGHREHASLRTKTSSHADKLSECGAECGVTFHCEA